MDIFTSDEKLYLSSKAVHFFNDYYAVWVSFLSKWKKAGMKITIYIYYLCLIKTINHTLLLLPTFSHLLLLLLYYHPSYLKFILLFLVFSSCWQTKDSLVCWFVSNILCAYYYYLQFLTLFLLRQHIYIWYFWKLFRPFR